MAKRQGTRGQFEHALMGAAEDLGTFFGTVAKRVETWVSERDQLAAQLKEIQGTAGQLLGRLGETPRAWTDGRRVRTKGAPAGQGVASDRPTKKRTFSAATRRKMAAAQRARWAKVRREKE